MAFLCGRVRDLGHLIIKKEEDNSIRILIIINILQMTFHSPNPNPDSQTGDIFYYSNNHLVLVFLPTVVIILCTL